MSKVATAVALQRAVQRIRKVEGDIRDLKREIDALKRPQSPPGAFIGCGEEDIQS